MCLWMCMHMRGKQRGRQRVKLFLGCVDRLILPQLSGFKPVGSAADKWEQIRLGREGEADPVGARLKGVYCHLHSDRQHGRAELQPWGCLQLSDFPEQPLHTVHLSARDFPPLLPDKDLSAAIMGCILGLLQKKNKTKNKGKNLRGFAIWRWAFDPLTQPEDGGILAQLPPLYTWALQGCPHSSICRDGGEVCARSINCSPPALKVESVRVWRQQLSLQSFKQSSNLQLWSHRLRKLKILRTTLWNTYSQSK